MSIAVNAILALLFAALLVVTSPVWMTTSVGLAP